jgi:hypothetical protein
MHDKKIKEPIIVIHPKHIIAIIFKIPPSVCRAVSLNGINITKPAQNIHISCAIIFFSIINAEKGG